MTKSTTLAEKMAEEYANNVAQPMLRSMVMISRTEYFNRLKHAVEFGHAAAHQWIPVTPETMPEPFKPIQFYLKTDSILTGYYHISGCFLEKGEPYTYQIKDVSHYRYLDTTPPKQSNEKI